MLILPRCWLNSEIHDEISSAQAIPSGREGRVLYFISTMANIQKNFFYTG